MEYGALSVIPIAIILVMAFTTKRTLFPMLCGLGSAALILGGISEFKETILGCLYASFKNETVQWIIVMICLFGILLSILEKSGAVTSFGYWAGNFIKTKKAALSGSFLFGLMVFIDDYLNDLTVSTTMKSVTDKQGVPRVQLGYIVSTTAAPVCILFPISSWGVYFAGLMTEQGIGIEGNTLATYLSALPYAFYGWFAVAVCVLQLMGVIPNIGYLKEAYASQLASNDEAEAEAEEQRKAAKPWNFLLPIVVMVGLSIYDDVLVGAAAAIVVACLLYLVEKKLTCTELLETGYEGLASMNFVVVLTVLAFAVQNANEKLELAKYVISIVEPLMKGSFLPAVVFVVCALYAYATGCFWDMAAIVMPIVVPLSTAMGVNPVITSAAVFSAAAFGSNTCLFGDGVILASQGCQIEPMDLMRAVLPYATIAAVASFVAYLVVGFTC